MHYRFLKKWVYENQNKRLSFEKMEKFEDQYAIFFRKQEGFLQINLTSENSFCFITEKDILSFESDAVLKSFNSHLSNTKLEKIEISDSDRIIYLLFSKIDIYNQKVSFKLIFEFIPRFQNLILTKGGEIVDCIRKISFAENRHRQILPGTEYTSPLTGFQVKQNEIQFPLSILSKKEIRESSDKHPFFNSINDFFEEMYYNWIFQEKNENRKQKEINSIKKKINRKQNTIAKLKTELSDAQKEEKWKQQAELLKANYVKIKSGMDSITLQNYYEEGYPEIKIPLKKEKNTKQNIVYYFKKYRKARDGKKKIAERIEIVKNDIKEFEQQIIEIEKKEIFLSGKKKTGKKKKESLGFRRLVVNKDWKIYIGRTSKENDLLTTRLAKPHDWWFHTRIFHGTHVILRNLNKKELPDNLKLICSKLAAYYSKAKKSSNVPVDYTQIRYVRKPRGSDPGFVTYTDQKTLFVDPISMRDAAKLISRLL
ncbi:MAG: DUF814 domain-containing protein [Candidatus Cloacimonetes bacterium]|nr:DUF814 domain-containing protein [Candidatus Cloacimonadota bacterium]